MLLLSAHLLPTVHDSITAQLQPVGNAKRLFAAAAAAAAAVLLARLFFKHEGSVLCMYIVHINIFNAQLNIFQIVFMNRKDAASQQEIKQHHQLEQQQRQLPQQ